MANKFVWSGAGGLNDGSSWDNAYTTLMKDWGAEAGFTPATDYVYVRSVHSETSASTLSITGSTAGTTVPCRIVCCAGDTTGTSPGALATGATVTMTSTSGYIGFNEGLYIYGVKFFSADDMNLTDTTTDTDVCLEACRLELTGTSSSDIIWFWNSPNRGYAFRLVNTDIDFGNASQGLKIQSCYILWLGGKVDYDVDALMTLPIEQTVRVVKLVGVDLSVMTSSTLVAGASIKGPGLVLLSRCLLATGATAMTGTIAHPGARVESYHCQIGTDADPSYQMEIRDAHGKVSADTAHYRTGGASDGVRATPIGWDFDTTATLLGYPGHAFEGPPITAWTDGDGSAAHTYRIYFASDASIKDDELWMELEGPNDAATNSLAALKTTRVAPLTAAAAYTTDATSTWNGTGVTTAQYMEISYTPDKPGPVTVRVMMAKASDNIYVDPMIVIDP